VKTLRGAAAERLFDDQDLSKVGLGDTKSGESGSVKKKKKKKKGPSSAH